MIAYKLLTVVKGELWSFNCLTNEIEEGKISKFDLKYCPGKIIKPKIKGTKLFVFKILTAAQDWARFSSRYEIWRVEVDELIKPKNFCGPAHWSEYNQYWKGEYQYCSPFPDGTRFCNTIKLIEKIS